MYQNKNLDLLFIRNLKLEHVEIQDLIAEFCQAVTSSTSLKHMALGKIYLMDSDSEDLARMVRNNLRLKYLYLWLTRLTDVGKSKILSAVRETMTLTKLGLAGGFKDGMTAVSFLHELPNNTSLKAIGLGLNLDDRCAGPLMEAIKPTYGLEDLCLHGNGKCDKIANTILRLNKAGRRYLVEDPASKEKGVELLIEVKDDVNCSFFHLLENPSLCERNAERS